MTQTAFPPSLELSCCTSLLQQPLPKIRQFSTFESHERRKKSNGHDSNGRRRDSEKSSHSHHRHSKGKGEDECSLGESEACFRGPYVSSILHMDESSRPTAGPQHQRRRWRRGWFVSQFLRVLENISHNLQSHGTKTKDRFSPGCEVILHE